MSHGRCSKSIGRKRSTAQRVVSDSFESLQENSIVDHVWHQCVTLASPKPDSTADLACVSCFGRNQPRACKAWACLMACLASHVDLSGRKVSRHALACLGVCLSGVNGRVGDLRGRKVSRHALTCLWARSSGANAILWDGNAKQTANSASVNGKDMLRRSRCVAESAPRASLTEGEQIGAMKNRDRR